MLIQLILPDCIWSHKFFSPPGPAFSLHPWDLSVGEVLREVPARRTSPAPQPLVPSSAPRGLSLSCEELAPPPLSDPQPDLSQPLPLEKPYSPVWSLQRGWRWPAGRWTGGLSSLRGRGASGNKNIGATVRIGREFICLPYTGFFSSYYSIIRKTWKHRYLCKLVLF